MSNERIERLLREEAILLRRRDELSELLRLTEFSDKQSGTQIVDYKKELAFVNEQLKYIDRVVKAPDEEPHINGVIMGTGALK